MVRKHQWMIPRDSWLTSALLTQEIAAMVCSFALGKELSSMAVSNYATSVLAGCGRGELGLVLGEGDDEGA